MDLFSKCRTLRRRFKKHNLTTEAASNYGAFDWDESVFGESYSKTKSQDGCNETTPREHKSKRAHSFTAATCGTWRDINNNNFYSSKDSICNTDDIASETAKEFTNEMKLKITSLLNCLYADEFVEDTFLLEVILILFTSEKRLELQENSKDANEQKKNAHELQEWIDIMTEKIHGGESETVIARQGRIPGPVGRPVIGGRMMYEWLRETK